MKRTFLLIVSLLVLSGICISQVPDAFNYQAVVRNVAGEVVADQAVSFKISILQNSEVGSVVYAETHSATTNGFGLANLKIGRGTITEGVFSPGGWGAAPHFIKIELDPAGGSSFTHMGTSQLLAVPYAYHAHSVTEANDADADPNNEFQTISLVGSDLSLSDGGGTVTLPSGGSSPWSESGDNIYLNTGNVGIGTIPVGAKLHIEMNSTVPEPHITLEEFESDYARLSYKNTANPTKYWTWAGLTRPADPDSRMNLWYFNGSAGKDIIKVTGAGDVILSDELNSGNTGASNMMPFAYGHVLSSGTKNYCTPNVGTIEKVSTGQYKVNIAGLGNDYTVVVTPNQGISFLTGVVSARSSALFTVAIWNTIGDAYADGGFSFIVYKP